MKRIISENCSICDEFNKEKTDSLYYVQMKELYEKCNISDRILYENEQFIVIPSLGPVSECHLLVIPKNHVCSFSLLNSEQLSMAEELVKKVRAVVERVYGNSMVFEHGTLKEEMQSSASCNHAHMHIVSCGKSLIPFLEKDGLQLRRIKKMSELREQKQRGVSYFYYSEDTSQGFIMDDIIQKSQYMRILIADILKTPEKGNWKINFGSSEMIAMILKLKKEFEHI